MKKITLTQKLTLGAMVCALNVVCLYATSVFPSGKLALYFLSGLFVYALTVEKAYISSIVSFLASSLLAFLIIPNKLVIIPYVCLLGHYGIFKTFIDEKIKDGIGRILLKLVYSNLFFALAAALAYYVFNVCLAGIALTLPIWLLVIIAEIALVVYDFLYLICEKIYENRIRRFIIPKR